MKTKRLLTGVFALMVVVLTIAVITSATLWETNSKALFNEGTYTDTYYNINGGYVQLNATYYVGNYTSKIHDANYDSQWNNISWTHGGYYQQPLPNFLEIEADLGGANMTNNILLFHLNANIFAGENATHIKDFSGNSNYADGIHTENVSNGKINGGFLFNAQVGEKIYVNNTVAGNFASSDAFTVLLWANISTADADVGIIQKYNLSRGWTFYTSGAKKAIIDLRADSTQYIRRRGDQVVVDNNWHLLAFTYNGSGHLDGLHFYFDGVIDDSASDNIDNLTGRQIAGSPNPIEIGILGEYGNYRLRGIIDEVSIWNRVLSQTEILNIYKRGALMLNLSVRSCNDSACDTETWVDVSDISPTNTTVADNRYFQYKFNFKTYKSTYSPLLHNVTVNYTVLNIAPTITHNSPQNNSYTQDNSALLNMSAHDMNSENMTVWVFGDGAWLTTLYNQTNESYTTHNWTALADGLHNWTAIANDGLINSTQAYSYFTVDTTDPYINVSYPVNGTDYLIYGLNTSIALNYTAIDTNIVSCWFENITSQNVTLAGCNNGTITFPYRVDASYNITLWANDSSARYSSSQVFFSANYSHGVMNNTQMNITDEQHEDIWFMIYTNSTCADDWCDNVTVKLIYDTNYCEIYFTDEDTYSLGVFGEGAVITQNWTARCNLVGSFRQNFIFSVNYTVQNLSFSYSSQNVSIFTTIGKKHYEWVDIAKKQIDGGDTQTLFVSIEDPKGSYVSGEIVNATVYYPNETIWIQDETFTEFVPGLYRLRFTVPSAPIGEYAVLFENNFWIMKSFLITTAIDGTGGGAGTGGGGSGSSESTVVSTHVMSKGLNIEPEALDLFLIPQISKKIQQIQIKNMDNEDYIVHLSVSDDLVGITSFSMNDFALGAGAIETVEASFYPTAEKTEGRLIISYGDETQYVDVSIEKTDNVLIMLAEPVSANMPIPKIMFVAMLSFLAFALFYLRVPPNSRSRAKYAGMVGLVIAIFFFTFAVMPAVMV